MTAQKTTQEEQIAKLTRKDHMAKSKEEVFDIWRRECCGRINGPDIREQRKSWMVYDLIAKWYGKAIADRVA